MVWMCASCVTLPSLSVARTEPVTPLLALFDLITFAWSRNCSICASDIGAAGRAAGCAWTSRVRQTTDAADTANRRERTSALLEKRCRRDYLNLHPTPNTGPTASISGFRPGPFRLLLETWTHCSAASANTPGRICSNIPDE